MELNTTECAVITGPTGAVGISLINELLKHEIAVTAIVRPGSERIDAIPKNALVTIVECSLDSLATFENELKAKNGVFFHLGWDGTFGDSRLDLKRQLKNAEYTLDAVYLASKSGCSVFVGVGSQSEYGHVYGKISPNLSCNPDNGYGIAKLTASLTSRILCHELGMRHEWCRILSLFGPYDAPYTLVMSTINRLLAGEKQQFTKAEQIWDFIYSEDAAFALRLVAEKGKDGSIYCLGSGSSRKLADYITTIRDKINPHYPLVFGELPYYPNQVMHLEANISNLTEDTGFTPQFSFEQGLEKTIEWVRKSMKRTE